MSKMRQKIYIAGPYTAPTVEQMEDNTRKVMDIALRIMAKGHIPFVPHLSHYLDMYAKENHIDIPYEGWFDWDHQWLRECDALYYVSSSPGTDKELAYAQYRKMDIYTALSQIPMP